MNESDYKKIKGIIHSLKIPIMVLTESSYENEAVYIIRDFIKKDYIQDFDNLFLQ